MSLSSRLLSAVGSLVTTITPPLAGEARARDVVVHAESAQASAALFERYAVAIGGGRMGLTSAKVDARGLEFFRHHLDTMTGGDLVLPALADTRVSRALLEKIHIHAIATVDLPRFLVELWRRGPVVLANAVVAQWNNSMMAVVNNVQLLGEFADEPTILTEIQQDIRDANLLLSQLWEVMVPWMGEATHPLNPRLLLTQSQWSRGQLESYRTGLAYLAKDLHAEWAERALAVLPSA